MNLAHQWFCRSRRWQTALENGLPWVIDGIDLGDPLLEVGPGPGLATGILRRDHPRMISVEIDGDLAIESKRRGGRGVRVLRGDGTRLPFCEGAFSGAVCFTMLHHVPSERLQDQLLREVHRVLRPGGVFAGSDSRWSRLFGLFHMFDTMVVVDPDGFGERLESAGFGDVHVDKIEGAFRFRGTRVQ